MFRKIEPCSVFHVDLSEADCCHKTTLNVNSSLEKERSIGIFDGKKINTDREVRVETEQLFQRLTNCNRSKSLVKNVFSNTGTKR